MDLPRKWPRTATRPIIWYLSPCKKTKMTQILVCFLIWLCWICTCLSQMGLTPVGTSFKNTTIPKFSKLGAKARERIMLLCQKIHTWSLWSLLALAMSLLKPWRSLLTILVLIWFSRLPFLTTKLKTWFCHPLRKDVRRRKKAISQNLRLNEGKLFFSLKFMKCKT